MSGMESVKPNYKLNNPLVLYTNSFRLPDNSTTPSSSFSQLIKPRSHLHPDSAETSFFKSNEQFYQPNFESKMNQTARTTRRSQDHRLSSTTSDFFTFKRDFRENGDKSKMKDEASELSPEFFQMIRQHHHSRSIIMTKMKKAPIENISEFNETSRNSREKASFQISRQNSSGQVRNPSNKSDGESFLLFPKNRTNYLVMHLAKLRNSKNSKSLLSFNLEKKDSASINSESPRKPHSSLLMNHMGRFKQKVRLPGSQTFLSEILGAEKAKELGKEQFVHHHLIQATKERITKAQKDHEAFTEVKRKCHEFWRAFEAFRNSEDNESHLAEKLSQLLTEKPLLRSILMSDTSIKINKDISLNYLIEIYRLRIKFPIFEMNTFQLYKKAVGKQKKTLIHRRTAMVEANLLSHMNRNKSNQSVVPQMDLIPTKEEIADTKKYFEFEGMVRHARTIKSIEQFVEDLVEIKGILWRYLAGRKLHSIQEMENEAKVRETYFQKKKEMVISSIEQAAQSSINKSLSTLVNAQRHEQRIEREMKGLRQLLKAAGEKNLYLSKKIENYEFKFGKLENVREEIKDVQQRSDDMIIKLAVPVGLI